MHCIKDVWTKNRINEVNLNIFHGNFNGRFSTPEQQVPEFRTSYNKTLSQSTAWG